MKNIFEGDSSSNPISERKDRKELPKKLVEGGGFSEESREADDVEQLHESETRDKERRSEAFIPIEEIADPDSEISIEERIDSETEEAETEEGRITEIESALTPEEKMPRPLSTEERAARAVASELWVSPEQWAKLSPEGRKKYLSMVREKQYEAMRRVRESGKKKKAA